MKLINYNRGYNSHFECSIHGTIEMTEDEFKEVKAYLYKSDDYFHLSSGVLMRDMETKIITSKGFYVNIRVTATDLIARKYNLSNYKKGNYQLFIKKNKPTEKKAMAKSNIMRKNSTIEWVIEILESYRDNEEIDLLPSFDILIDELDKVKNLK